MRVAWCPSHRGVMRISFFDPKPPHFNDPCPRCQGVLVEQIRNKYQVTCPGSKDSELNNPGASGIIPTRIPGVREFRGSTIPDFNICPPDQHLYTINCTDNCNFIFPDEIPVRAPKPLCQCCYTFTPGFHDLVCKWCIDCPTDYCDVPRNVLEKERNRKMENRAPQIPTEKRGY